MIKARASNRQFRRLELTRGNDFWMSAYRTSTFRLKRNSFRAAFPGNQGRRSATATFSHLHITAARVRSL